MAKRCQTHLVHDLAVLADQRRRAGTANTSDALEDWHRYALPAFLDRMTARLKSHCENGHQTWPSTGRHARHSSDPHRRRRLRAFKDDAHQLAPQPIEPTTQPPRLTIIDGDVVDSQTGEIL